MKWIKIGLRNNLFYLLMLTIFNFLRKIDLIIMDKVIGLKASLILTFLMFLGEFIAGLIVYLYQKSFFREQEASKFMGIELIQASTDISYPDSDYKICFLIFFISYFDFIESIVGTFYIPQFDNISKSLVIRLGSMLTISASLLSCYFLRLPIYKHQKCSLLITFICSIIVLISEYYFQIIYKLDNISNFSFVIGLIFMNHFFTAFKDVIEKYLLEIDYINPFKLLMTEGLFGCIMASIYLCKEEPFEKIKDIYQEKDYKVILLIICLFLYFFLSGGRNIYRVVTNMIYSPMTRTITDAFLYPLLITYYYFYEKDFSNGENDNKKIIYFIINLVVSIIIDICGCVYNDILVLFFCDLERNTHYVLIDKIRNSSNYTNIFRDSTFKSDKNISENDITDNDKSEDEKLSYESEKNVLERINEKNTLEDNLYIKDKKE